MSFKDFTCQKRDIGLCKNRQKLLVILTLDIELILLTQIKKMRKLKVSKMLLILVCTIIFTLRPEKVLPVSSSESFDTSNIIIKFDPDVSILDAYSDEHFRYSTEDLVPLVALVATRFTKMMVTNGCSKFPTQKLNSSAFATALYNCLNNTETKIQLVLVVPILDFSCKCSYIQPHIQIITNFADEVNKLCNETIHSIVLQSYYFCPPNITAHCSEVVSFTDRYIWGQTINVNDDFCDSREIQNITILTAVEKMSIQKPAQIIADGISDTLDDNSINMKNAVYFWRNLTKRHEYNFILAQAFDTYEQKDTLQFQTNGWWFLAKDSGTTNTTQFIFKEKIKVAAQIDMEENPAFLPWYLDTPFDKNVTGIIFHGHFATHKMDNEFCRVMCIEELDDLDNVKNKAADMISLCGERFELVLVLEKVPKNVLTELYELREHVTILKSFEFIGDVDIDILKQIATADLSNTVKDLGFKTGHYVDLDDCVLYQRQDMTFNFRILENTFVDPQSSIIIFHYEENEIMVKLGATRMFRIRKLQFDLCRKLVFTIRNTSVELGFAAKSFFKLQTFHDSPWAMKNYLRYVDLMNKWAKSHPATVIFLGQDEDRIIEIGYQTFGVTVGWFSYIDFLEKNGYKQKDNQLLHVPATTNSKSIILSNIQIAIVICSLLLITIFLLIISICFIRRYKKIYQLSNEERELFFKGTSSDNSSDTRNPNDMPYDKNKYEIPQGNFKIDTTQKLGSGAFGMVCRGTVNISEEEIQVAVKTTNPQKLHTTVLKCLLSEIKILSHIGLHPNIIKLFGAHTVNIRTGKVYVFLELCHLGSLLNFLQNLGTTNPVSATNASNVETKKDINYVNTASSKKYLLDASLSNDLYRWSKEICNGMTFLAEKCVVHADLATRNVLLNLRREAKICDFGLSRRMYNYESYVKSQQEPLPWKWMAPESLRYMQFNEKTDVWAYGVTLWELYSLGSVPYAGLSWDANFVQMLEGGLVPSKPDFEEKNMYKIMQDCWKVIPDQRPTFAQIMSLLDVTNAETSDNKDDGEADVSDDALYQNV